MTPLDQFLVALPSGWCYAVELRNRCWLVREYFEIFRSHNVVHFSTTGRGFPRHWSSSRSKAVRRLISWSPECY